MSFRIGISQLLHNLTSVTRDLQTVANQMSTGKKINSAEDDPATWARIARSRSEFARYTAINDSLNGVATSISIADGSMDAIGKTIDEMKNSLGLINEHTPPWPIGSSERTRLIDSYNQLRQQIDQLAAPTDEGAKKIMADPAIGGGGDWTVVVGPNGMTRTIRKEEVHTGPTGLDIPALSSTATDAEIQTALARLAMAKDTLSTRQEDLEMDSVAIAKSQDYNKILGTAHLVYAENTGAADMTEAAAKEKSLELRQSLSNEMLKMLTDADARVLQLLG